MHNIPQINNQRVNGFTLIELILVIILVSTLAIVAAPQFQAADPFASLATENQLISATRYAQQIAMVRGPAVTTTLVTTATNYQINVDGAPILLPNGNLVQVFPDGSNITAANVQYTSLGDVPAGLTTLTITVAGEANRNVCIEATGYAHGC